MNIEKLNEADKIYVTNWDVTKLQTVCYKEDRFKKMGWCKVQGTKNGWGFCSSSCERVSEKVRTATQNSIITTNILI